MWSYYIIFAFLFIREVNLYFPCNVLVKIYKPGNHFFYINFERFTLFSETNFSI